jgi:hypothetical protein
LNVKTRIESPDVVAADEDDFASAETRRVGLTRRTGRARRLPARAALAGFAPTARIIVTCAVLTSASVVHVTLTLPQCVNTTRPVGFPRL